ncbi:hypothetical protein ACFL6S_32920 [Candidatus Poribacteria bacterium]
MEENFKDELSKPRLWSERRLSSAKPVSKPSERICSAHPLGFDTGYALLNRRYVGELNNDLS